MNNSFERPPQSGEEDQDTGGTESREQPGEYLYCLAPVKQEGDTLMSLNELKDKHPEAFASAAAKYQGREHVMDWDIPGLNAKWNDVLHLTAVHPLELKQALIGAGWTPPEMKWYKIPKSAITADMAVVYSGESPSGQILDEEVQPYDANDLAKHAELPEATKRYYQREIKEGRKPLLFLGVPHILYRG